MATRAVYTFKDHNGAYHVFKSYDNYPSMAKQHILNAVLSAYPLPRFEASEFGASFIYSNKDQGDVNLSHHYTAHTNLDYRYEITFDGSNLIVSAFVVRNPGDENLLFHGSFERFIQQAKKLDEAPYQIYVPTTKG